MKHRLNQFFKACDVLWKPNIPVCIYFRNHFLFTTNFVRTNTEYCQVSNISSTLVGNEIVDHPDVVGASPIGAAPTTSSFST